MTLRTISAAGHYRSAYAPTDDQHYTNKAYVDAQVAARLPSGSMVLYGGSSAPTGFLMCDGSAVSRTTYADLFTAIGTAYGVGDGSTTFNVPDLRQRFPLGKAAAGTGANLGDTGGTIDHTHDTDVANSTSGGPSATVGVTAGSDVNVGTDSHTHDTDPASATSDSDNPPFCTVNFVIKT